MRLAFSVACAVLPAAALVWWFWRRDVRREPLRPLLETFGLGVLVVVPVLALVLPLEVYDPWSARPLLASVYWALLCAAVPEELLKYVVVRGYAAHHPEFDEPMDGVVYGATASLGFAAMENVVFLAEGGWSHAIVRGLTAVPMHACVGAILGYHVALARLEDRRGLGVRGLLLAILLHALYDLPLFAADEAREILSETGHSLLLAASALVLLVTYVWTHAIVKRLRAEQLAR